MTSTRVTLAFSKVNVNARDSLPRGTRINPTDPLIRSSDVSTDEVERNPATG